jgi:EAL domain-containing protein (putative c-di-GMP-specific phosphodiesterase class I)
MSEPQTAGPDPRNRLLGFAFASADLLIEARPDATITWTAGAFRARFGQDPEAFIGCALSGLIAATDQDALDVTLAEARERGRAAPVTLHLNDAAGTPFAVAMLALPGREPRLCVTIGPLPAPTPPRRPAQPVPASGFRRTLEEQFRAGQDNTLGLLDVGDWNAATRELTTEERAALRVRIEHSLGETGGAGALVSTLSDGRFSLVTRDSLDLKPLVAELERLFPDAGRNPVDSMAIHLVPEGLTGPQAVRALRFALDRFVAGGTKAAAEAGFADGLAGFVHQASAKAAAVRRAIAERRMHLAFQPVVGIRDRVIHHYEALLRPIPSHALPTQSAHEFVTFAEAVGLSEELDLAVLDLVLRALGTAPDARIAANLSGLSVQSVPFHERIFARLNSAPPGHLLVELTETAEIDNVAAAATLLAALRARGVPVCIDDFGAGAAAFRYLRDFRVDFVKLDGAYVTAASDSANDRSLLHSMIDVAHSVGAQAIAEVVETEEVLRLMQTLGADFIQGWLVGRPGRLPAR